MAKTAIGGKGVVTSKGGAGVTVKAPMTVQRDVVLKGPMTVQSGVIHTVTPLTSNTTLTNGGVYTVSGSAVLTITVPNPADVPGSHFILRSLSVHAHQVSSSQVTQDSQTITDGTSVGARLDLPAVVGSSVVMVSDGANYLVPITSGSVTISTPAI